MSQSKIDRKMHSQNYGVLEKEICRRISAALRERHKDSTSAIKVISRETGAAVRAVRNWFDGNNSPSLSHFIILSRRYHELLEVYADLCLSIELPNSSSLRFKGVGQFREQIYEPLNEPYKPYEAALSPRQRLLLKRLEADDQLGLRDICHEFRISLATAKRDLASLRKAGLIKRQGSRKSGNYVVSLPCA